MKTEPYTAKRQDLVETFYLAVVFLFFILCIVAKADTYNFYFDDKKKKTADSGEQEEPPAPAPVPTSPSSQTVTVPSGTQPMIINNTVTVPSVVPAPVAAPTAAVPLRTVNDPSAALAMEQVAEMEAKRPSRWELAVSAVAINLDSLGSAFDKNRTDHGVAGAISFRILDSLGLRLYGGIQGGNESKPFAGFEADFIPIRTSISHHNVLELGLIAGASTLMASFDHIGTLHGGVKSSLFLTETLGIVVLARGNMGYGMGECGLVVRL